VVDEHGAFAFAAQRAMPARDAGGRARQRDVRRVRDFFRADQQAAIREAHGVATEQDVRDRQRAARRGCGGGNVFDAGDQRVVRDARDVAAQARTRGLRDDGLQ
jgi:hypothetical protein